MKDLYETDRYEQLNPDWHEADAPWKARHIAAMVQRNGLDPATIAEVGCGTGQILVELAAAHPQARLAGYEISPSAHRRAVQHQTERLTFHLQDVTETDLHVDLMLAIDVFEHVEDYLGFLARLRPRAERTIFHIPLDLSAQAVARGRPLVHAREVVGHLHSFTKDTALATLTDCGYTVLDHVYTAGRLELSHAETAGSRLLRLPRRILFRLAPDLAVRLLGGYSLLVLAR